MDNDSSELFSDIDLFLKNREAFDFLGNDGTSEELLKIETCLKAKTIKRFFEQYYSGDMLVHDDLSIPARQMCGRFKKFLTGLQAEYHEIADFEMESFVGGINLDDVLTFTNNQIALGDFLLSQGVDEYDNFPVSLYIDGWRYVSGVAETAAAIDKKIQRI